MTRLLASVATLDELALAARGGVDILDLKDPKAGALGAWPLNGIARAVSEEWGEGVIRSEETIAIDFERRLRDLAKEHDSEALLLQIAEYAEEWLTSAQSLGLATRTDTGDRIVRRRAVAPAEPRRHLVRTNGHSRL